MNPTASGYPVGYASNTTIRTWALKNGHNVAEFGPIAYDVRMAFEAAWAAAVREASAQWLTEAGRWEIRP